MFTGQFETVDHKLRRKVFGSEVMAQLFYLFPGGDLGEAKFKGDFG